MSKKPYNWTRRDFLKTAGAVGVGSLIAPVGRLADAAKFQGPIPTRPFGKTGANVSILSLGDVRYSFQSIDAQTSRQMGCHLLGHGPFL